MPFMEENFLCRDTEGDCFALTIRKRSTLLHLNFLVMLFAVLLSALVTNSFAQSDLRTITGTVVNNNGEPMHGVSVTLKGASTATTTATDGSYSIRVQSEGSVLVFSFVGMTAQEQPVANKSLINVTLLAATGNLD